MQDAGDFLGQLIAWSGGDNLAALVHGRHGRQQCLAGNPAGTVTPSFHH